MSQVIEYQTITFEIENHVATITLNRPDAANGMNMQMGKELMDAAIRCQGNPEVRCVLITAHGKMFSAGGDLKSFAAYGDDISAKLQEMTVYLNAVSIRLAKLDAPVVIAVNGIAAGAGFSLAVSGDIVLAAESAKFTMAYTAAGLTPDVGASYYLPRLIGLRKTQELMITNRRISAAEALEWGAVTRVVADDEIHSEAKKLAEQLANGPTRAFATVKNLLNSSFDNQLDAQLDKEACGIAAMSGSKDGYEGITAFMEKRAPKFTGE